MTERDVTQPSPARLERAAELRQIVDLVARAEAILVSAAGRLDQISKPVGPPNPPPPPWHELISLSEKRLAGCATALTQAQRSVTALGRR